MGLGQALGDLTLTRSMRGIFDELLDFSQPRFLICEVGLASGMVARIVR